MRAIGGAVCHGRLRLSLTQPRQLNGLREKIDPKVLRKFDLLADAEYRPSENRTH